MEKIWSGRAKGSLAKAANDFNSSIRVDSRMFREDIAGSMEHAAMLSAVGILPPKDADAIIDGLQSILDDLESGALAIDPEAEDIHSFVEAELTARIGDAGKKLHTARSRNDQVALDLRLFLKEESAALSKGLYDLLSALYKKASENTDTILPGYTHLQRAQPITFAQHLLAYTEMFRRDLSRLSDAVGRMNLSPLGSAALAGTTYPIDRAMVASRLGFAGVTSNSLDGVSDRDFCVELLSTLSLIMVHLSRLSEEILLWTSLEFSFVELDDSYTTGSSIMPQKKNSDMAELIRGKTGRVFGDLVGTLTMLKGLPLAYNKDLQEDKEAIFDGFDTVKSCLTVMVGMIDTMKVNKGAMLEAAKKGFLNATDLADYLTKKGMPFREAYQTVGRIVAYCIEHKQTLESLPLADYKTFSSAFEEDLYTEIALETCVKKRISEGGTGYDSVEKQLKDLFAFLVKE